MKPLKKIIRPSNTSRKIRLLVVSVFMLAVSLLAYTSKLTTPTAFAEEHIACNHPAIEFAGDVEPASGQGCFHSPDSAVPEATKVSFANATLPAQPQSGNASQQERDTFRKKSTIEYRDSLIALLRLDEHSVKFYQQMIDLDNHKRSWSPYGYGTQMTGHYQQLLTKYQQSRDAHANELRQVNAALENWDTWGRERKFAWENRPAVNPGPSLPPGYYADDPCRECGYCRGRGSLEQLGNPYHPGRTGYRPAQTCPNCNGTGQVYRR